MKFFIHRYKRPLFFVSIVINIVLLLVIAQNLVSMFVTTQEDPAHYPFLSPRIFAENQHDILINFVPLRQTLKKQVESYGDTYAFFFEYLPTGTSIGVNEKNQYSSGSLIKLPIVMAYYHQEERTGVKRGGTIVKIQQDELDNMYGTLWQRGAGSDISFDEAITKSLVESDNTAIRVLAHYIEQEDFQAVYQGLDIDFQQSDHEGVLISAKQYSSILKALYLSSIINKEHSQKILDMLTRTEFIDKLPAGVPKSIPVAHKVGVDQDGYYQDCGIVFVPKRPYTLCMISRTNEDVARERMTVMSKAVYEFVVSVPKGPTF